MSTIHAFWLGLIQGLTEFLPVSSSGHLLLLQKIFGIDANGQELLLFNILLHVGTLIAVCIVYWRRILEMIMHPIESDLKYLVVATIPAVIAALVIDFDSAFDGAFLCWSFWATTLVLLLGDFIGTQRRRAKLQHREVTLRDSLAMGVLQAVAILPGLSRSGSTISGGVISGLSRRRAADFAFMMSIPAILGSVVLEGKDFITGEATSTVGGLQIIIGVAVAAISGFLAIKFMLWLVKKISLRWFAAYTFLVGTFVLIDKYFMHMWF